ncbi:helix-turn-helix domain-containing protein [Xylanibacter muris]|uniref:helix-turn-helix domain-containing protein n=1 Tax=Xylanibacter muris TaxID=2736290 RepID=UPI0025A0D619|nr:helix-turn-helix domain-containing protein [Xylanibacter muris]
MDNAEVCRQLHISKRTLQYLRNSGKLPYSTLGNKCYYKPEDVRVLLDKDLTIKCG